MGNLKLLRNNSVFADHESAINGIEKILNTLNNGEVAIATYTSGDGFKTVLGIRNLSYNQYFDYEDIIETVKQEFDGLTAANVKLSTVNNGNSTSLTATDVQNGIQELFDKILDDEEVDANAINALITVLGSSAKNEDKKITYVPQKDIEALKDTTSFTDALIKLAQLIDNLNVTDAPVAKSFVTSVSEEKGKIIIVRGTISSDGTININDNTDGGVNLNVNIDESTIIKGDNNKLSVASAALTQYDGSNAINVSDVDTATNKKTISLVIPNSETVLSQDNDGLKTTITIVKNNNPNNVNVREEYYLQGKTEGTALGETIKIYKDSSLVDFYLGHIDDKLTNANETSGESSTSDITDGTGDTALVYIVQLANGNYKLTTINVEEFLQESEFKDGLQVNNHQVSVKIDDSSEKYLTVGENGVKLSGIEDNEEVTSNAINALTTVLGPFAINEDKKITYNPSTDDEIIKNTTSFSDALQKIITNLKVIDCGTY